jgi:hypothetical protein
MAQFYAITPVTYVGNHVRPGTLLDSVADAATYNAYVAAGGITAAAGDASIAAAALVAAGLILRGADDATLQTVMLAAYVADAATDTIVDAGNLITATTIEGALQELAAGSISVQKRTVTIAFGDLSGLAGGVKTFTAAMGSALPANARFVGVTIGEGTFTGFDDGGGGGTATLKVGSVSSDTNAVSTVNVATGQSGFPKAGTAGARGFDMAPLFAEVYNTILTSNHDLNTFTAGSVVVNLFFTVKA